MTISKRCVGLLNSEKKSESWLPVRNLIYSRYNDNRGLSNVGAPTQEDFDEKNL